MKNVGYEVMLSGYLMRNTQQEIMWSEFHSGVVLHPDLQPCSHRVGLGPPVVNAHIFLDGLLQLFLDLGLRLAEDIFDDGLSGFRIVNDSVSSLPAAILSFSDVAFPVRSSF